MTDAPTTDFVTSRTVAGVATITLDSPANRNALSRRLIEQLLAALAAAQADAATRVIVLSHTGPVFSSGADLKETAASQGAQPEPGSRRGAVPISRLGDVLAAIRYGGKPVLARVGGPARAGGIGLIAAADLAIVARSATFAFTEVRIGVIPAVISATVLPRLGTRAADELYLTGDTFDGARAAEVGLVTAAVPDAELDATVRRYTDALLRAAPAALAGTKALLRRVPEEVFRAELDRLTDLSVGYFRSAEAAEGMLAFREKRSPHWVPRD